MPHRSKWLCTALFVSVVSCLVGVVQAQENPDVFAPNENVLGMSYGDWSAAWWQYMLIYTNTTSPYLDNASCTDGQGGPVYFLSGAPTIKTRDCTIPAGTALFMPIINGECSTVESGIWYGPNGQAARACAAAFMDTVGIDTLKFTVDEKPVKNLTSFRVQSPFFVFIVPSTDNFLGVDGVTTGSSVSDGYWVMVKPLKPGQHTVHFEGGGQNVTYILSVTP